MGASGKSLRDRGFVDNLGDKGQTAGSKYEKPAAKYLARMQLLDMTLQ